jgi:hypothetical protein
MIPILLLFVSSRRQDLSKLSTLAGNINNSVANALDSYRRLIRLQSNPSPDVLRNFAAFLINVASGWNKQSIVIFVCFFNDERQRYV